MSAPDGTAATNRGLFERGRAVLPGGVSSPVRAYRAVGGTPRILERGAGAYVTDVEGRTYLDFIGSWGPLILGHAPPRVVRAIAETAERGTTFGAPTRLEIELAERIRELAPWNERLRFVSSGTEATMSAIRLARGFTGRDLVVKLAGCYHGHADHLLVEAGSGLVTFGTPSSAGVPRAFADHTLVLPLDDEAALRETFAARGNEIAALIVEPIPANNGLLLQRPAYLAALREVTRAAGALLVLDEVISGFRVAPGGAAERLGLEADLFTYGKVIGGGLPVGAFGGRREVLERLAPLGDVYQAGTLSGNPVAMAAGLATLDELRERDGWARLEELGAALEALLAPVLARAPFPARLVRLGSIFWMSLQEGEPPRAAGCIAPAAAERYRGLFHGLLERGVMIAPSAFEVGFLSLAHTPEDLERFAIALDGALSQVR